MGKHSRKRQRTTGNHLIVEPLGTRTGLDDDAGKDDEERNLESLLFGTTFTSTTGASKPTGLTLKNTDPQEESDGLHNLLDSDLFYFDEAGPSTVPENIASSFPTNSENAENEEEATPQAVGDVDSEQKGSHGPEDVLTTSESVDSQPLMIQSSRKKKAAWADPDDQNITISLASDNRLRKLRDAPQEDTVGGRDYETKLRRQYEKIHPVPQWAANARRKINQKRRRSSQSSDSPDSGGEEAVTALLSSSGAVLSSHKRKTLPKGQLSIERLRDANQTAKADGDVKSVMFHPSPSVPMLLTASADRRLRLFNIDGHTNPHLQTVHIPSLPIASALFHPTGSSILLTGHRPFYYTFDLKSGTCIRSPRGLWGNFGSSQDTSDLSMETCAFSHTGDVLAVAGRRGYVHLVDWRTGGGQVVGSVKMNAAVKDLWWTREGRLMSLAEDAEVYLWDVGQRRCARRWKDDGGFGSKIMSGDRGGAYLAIGSKTGLVNVYGSDSTALNTIDTPKPLKTIGNLTTSISLMRFNHDAQILALASKSKKDQLKMVHLPSMTVFSNWPTTTTPLGHITSADFSAGSEYAAFGNNRGKVLLYSLGHYTSV